jgi:ParB family transcriptional regulator, chromosome partitioning protein
VIENEQREGLRPLELALFVQKRFALGDNQTEIAKRLGKSRQWVTLATALIEPPDWLLHAYRDGRCRGINELYELRRLHGEHGDVVEAWAAKQPNITRDRLIELRATLERPSGAAPALVVPAVQSSSQDAATGMATAAPPAIKTRPRSPVPGGDTPDLPVSPTRLVSPEPAAKSDQRVHVEFEGHDYQLVVSVVPDHAGCMYVRPLTGGPRRLAPVASLKLLGFVGG